MIKNKDVSNQLRLYTIYSDHTKLSKVMIWDRKHVNDGNDVNIDHEKLKNTDRMIAPNNLTQNLLLKVLENQEKNRKWFIEECLKDFVSSEIFIKKRKRYNFATEA